MLVARERFKLGRVVCTQHVKNLFAENKDFVLFYAKCLLRHVLGDWERDKQKNGKALAKISGAFPDFKANGFVPMWILTDEDKGVTTVWFSVE